MYWESTAGKGSIALYGSGLFFLPNIDEKLNYREHIFVYEIFKYNSQESSEGKVWIKTQKGLQPT